MTAVAPTLTAAQRTLWRAMTPGRYYTVPEVAALLDTSPAGAARTASSLVRRGLAVRASGKPVRYALS